MLRQINTDSSTNLAGVELGYAGAGVDVLLVQVVHLLLHVVHLVQLLLSSLHFPTAEEAVEQQHARLGDYKRGEVRQVHR